MLTIVQFYPSNRPNYFENQLRSLNHEKDKCDILSLSELTDEHVKNKARKKINVERRRNGLRSHYGNDNDDGIEKRNALLTMSALKEASDSKNCNKSTFASTRSSTHAQPTGIATCRSMKASITFCGDAELQNEKDLSNDECSSNVPLLKQQGLMQHEYTNQRKPLPTVASYLPRRDSSIFNEYIFYNNGLSSQVTTELLGQDKEKQLNQAVGSRVFTESTSPIETELENADEIFGRLESENKYCVIADMQSNNAEKALENHGLKSADSRQVFDVDTFYFAEADKNNGNASSDPLFDPMLFVPIFMSPVIKCPPTTLLSLIKSHISSKEKATQLPECGQATKMDKFKARFRRRRKDQVPRSATLSEKIMLRRGSKFVPRHRVKADLHRIKRSRRNFLCNWFEIVIKYSTATLGRKLDSFGDKHNYKYFPSATIHSMVHGFDPIERRIEHEDGAGQRYIVPACMEHIRQTYEMQCNIGFLRKSSEEDAHEIAINGDDDELISNTFTGNNDFIYVIVGLTNIFIMQFIMAIVIFFLKA